MKKINKIHREAMKLAEFGLLEKMDGNYKIALKFFKDAYNLEKQAAMSVKKNIDNEPTRSILFRSAASLAQNAKLFLEAENMIMKGLDGYPPPKIKLQLRNVFKEIAPEIYTEIIDTSVKKWQTKVAICTKNNSKFLIKTFDNNLSNALVSQKITGKTLKLVTLGTGSSLLITGGAAVVGVTGITAAAVGASLSAIADPEPITKTILIVIALTLFSLGGYRIYNFIKILVKKKYKFNKVVAIENGEILIKCEPK